MNLSLGRLRPQTLSALFLVAGTSIGGGMLALPVATSPFGFIPSLAWMLLAWFSMTMTALYLTEAIFWMKEEAHIISIANRFLGMPGKVVCWILYLFIGYASLIAYIAGGGHLISYSLQGLSSMPLSKEMGCLLFTFFFGLTLFLGNSVIGRVNAMLFSAMCIAYVLLIGLGSREIKAPLLNRYAWQGSWIALPLLITSFSFQTLVPSLNSYLKRHAPSLKCAIIGGTFLTFIIYALWQWVVLGTVPTEGKYGLSAALMQAEPATQFLGKAVESVWIEPIAHYFALFALVTSFLGIAMGLCDFLSDGLKIQRSGWGNLGISCLILFPCLYLAICYERAFLTALDITGSFGDSILNGIIPISIVWIGRYRFQLSSAEFKAPGGKITLIVIGVFYLLSLGIGVISTYRGVDTYKGAEDSLEKTIIQTN